MRHQNPYTKQPQKPYIPPSRFPDTRQVSKEIYKTDDMNLNNAMVSIISTANPSEILTYFQANVHQSLKDKDGNTPIHLIINIDGNKLNQQQKIDIIKHLVVPPLLYGIDTPNGNQETPLHLAIKNQYEEIIKFLIINGADPIKINAKHQNAMHIAMIPNIQPCERKVTPDAIINIDQQSEDKNTIYNEILSVLYNHRNDYKNAIETIKKHASIIADKYDERRSLRIRTLKPIEETEKKIAAGNYKPELIIDDTPVDRAIKDVQNKILNELSNPLSRLADIKKNVNYQIIKSLQNITEEYTNFVGASMNERGIDVENRSYIPTDVTDIKDIAKYIVGSDKKNYVDIEEKLQNMKNVARDKIYDDIDEILKVLSGGNYDLSRKSIEKPMTPLGVPDIIQNAMAPWQQIYDHIYDVTNIEDLAQGFNKDVTYIWNGDFDSYVRYIIAYDGNNPFNPAFDQYNPQQRQLLSEISNKLLCINEKTTSNMLSLFIYIYGSNLYSDSVTNFSKSKLIEYYNMLINFNNTAIKNDAMTIMPIPQNPQALRQAAGQMAPVTFTSLDPNNEIERFVVNKLNKILKDHINNINLWLSLDNITSVNPYDHNKQDGKIYETVMYNEVPRFIIFKTQQPAGPQYKIKLLKLNNTNTDLDDYLGQVGAVAAVAGSQKYDITEIKQIPNVFAQKIKDIDYMDLLKKRFILWFIEKITQPAPPGAPPAPNPFKEIYDEIEVIVKKYFKSIEELTNENIKIKVVSLVIKVLDRLFINTVKLIIYMSAVKKLKTDILNFNTQAVAPNKSYDEFVRSIIDNLSSILTKTNTSIKLDKQLNEMVLIQKDANPLNIPNIIDEDNINKINVDPNEPTQIFRKDEHGDYQVYYPKDYNSIYAITSRQCLYNTTATINAILQYSKYLDYYKKDINGFSPIYYAIHSGNYIIIKYMIGNIAQYQLQSQLNQNYESPIRYALKMIENTCKDKPNFKTLNATFMNNILLSSDINRNIPNKYYEIYKFIIEEYNKFINNPDTSNFKNLINITQPVKIFDTGIDISQIDINAITDGELNYDCNTIITDEIKIIVDKVDNLLLRNRSINDNVELIKSKKTHLINTISDLKKIVGIFEQRYKPNRLYKYTNNVRSSPISESNEYYLILISTGVLSVVNILKRYYVDVILKTIYTTDVFNFDFYMASTPVTHDTLMKTQVELIVNAFINNNLFDLVRIFYFIKVDQFDSFNTSQNIVEDYMVRQLDQFAQNGIINPDSTMYSNIKQYVNSHMIELITKTLQYNQVILDVIHKWLVNLYHHIRVFDELTNSSP